jgi:hypothetical protein
VLLRAVWQRQQVRQAAWWVPQPAARPQVLGLVREQALELVQVQEQEQEQEQEQPVPFC